jgi:hypothetical protein
MAGMNRGVIRQGEEHVLDTVQQLLVITPG